MKGQLSMDRHREIDKVIRKLELENKRSTMDWGEEQFKGSATELLAMVWWVILVSIGVFICAAVLLIPLTYVVQVIGTGITIAGATIIVGTLITLLFGDRPQFRLLLARDRLIEYGLFDRVRIFTYEQIYAVKTVKSALNISYYAYDANGKLNYQDRREARLLSTVNNDLFVQHLSQRMAAHKPIPKSGQVSWLLMLLLAGLLSSLLCMAAMLVFIKSPALFRTSMPIVGLIIAIGGVVFLAFMLNTLRRMQRSGLAIERKKKHE
jgi:hypothetical protein